MHTKLKKEENLCPSSLLFFNTFLSDARMYVSKFVRCMTFAFLFLKLNFKVFYFNLPSRIMTIRDTIRMIVSLLSDFPMLLAPPPPLSCSWCVGGWDCSGFSRLGFELGWVCKGSKPSDSVESSDSLSCSFWKYCPLNYIKFCGLWL